MADIVQRAHERAAGLRKYHHGQTDTAELLCEMAAEIDRLRGLVDSQSHGDTYGRRSGGAKEVLFK